MFKQLVKWILHPMTPLRTVGTFTVQDKTKTHACKLLNKMISLESVVLWNIKNPAIFLWCLLLLFFKGKHLAVAVSLWAELHIHLNPSQNITWCDVVCKYLPTSLSFSLSPISVGVTALNTSPGCLNVSSRRKCPEMQQRWQRESSNEAHLMKAFVKSTAVFFPYVLLWVRPGDRYEIKIER